MTQKLDKPGYWNNHYKTNNTPWDMGSANPVFVDLIKNYDFNNKNKILITGSGKGYDAVAASKEGFDVYSVDISEHANKIASEKADNENVKINFITGDIFQLHKKYKEEFEIIFEYTTYCAINPDRRTEYSDSVSALLKPDGILIALLFPVDGRKGGPPFNIDIIEFYQLFSKHLRLDISSNRIPTIKPRRGAELLQIYLKPESKYE